ncbi:MAG: EAL domain-containing response regulator [Nitrosomonadales bacterium]|nr:EAL domain-containing response regulator [Nitrosomonadales bacterium]
MLKKYAARILVLDDDIFMLRLLSRILGNLGFTSVAACENGHAALQLVDHVDSAPTLILLDLNMPGMDGAEFMHKLAERHYAGSIILVSGEDQRVLQTAQKMIQEHKVPLLGRISKPVTQESLAAILDKWDVPVQGGSKSYGAAEVSAAIANHELLNYYQPKVEVATGQVTGMETLVRWNHPDDGMVFPSQFIGVAETHGLIDDLTAEVLTKALAQAHSWQKSGLSLQLTVNVSMDNLASPDFADTAAQLATKAGVPPGQVMLEMKEKRLLQKELRAPLETLTRLRLKRFRLALDNFGTGRSSLPQLRDIPFDEIKIDRSIVHGASADPALRTKYDSSMITARELGMEVVAMGVDSLDDWELLRRTRCDFAQGHFIAKPMLAADLPAWRDEWLLRVNNNYR